MNDQHWHPTWCDPASCTAYSDNLEDELVHRSAPVVIATEDEELSIYLHRWAEADGSDGHITISEREGEICEPWYFGIPRMRRGEAEMLLDLDRAVQIHDALDALTHA